MRNFVVRCLVCAAASLAACAAQAAAQNPELVAHAGEGDDAAQQSKALDIAKLDLDVAIAGDTARTTVTAQFANTGSMALEGNFAFDLPRGSVVTGYALDIGDRMVDGVLAAKRQAKLVYEQRVRRGYDPGLAEVTRDGAFTTRVFPIVPGKGRTVRLSFVTPLDADRAFEIPLVTEKAVGAASIHVHLAGAAAAPRIAGPKGLSLSWSRDKDGYDATASASKRALSGTLAIGAMVPAALTLSRHRSGDSFFEIDDTVPPAAAAGTGAGRVRIYWDSSRSRRDDDLKPEIALAARYVDAVHPAVLDLVLFADGAPVVKTLTAPRGADLSAALAGVAYRGATSQASLFAARLAPADACLLFSDGNMSVDGWRPEAMACPLFTLSNAADANRGYLGALAERSGGSFVDLRAQSAETALATLASRAPRAIDVRDTEGRALDAQMLAANGNRIRIVGRLPDDGDIVVTLANAAEHRRVYAVDRGTIAANDGPGVLWASAHDRAMNATDRPDKDAMLALERRYSVAGAASDFVVFETIQDYIDAKVAPPESFDHDARNQYKLYAKAQDANRAVAEENRLDKVIAIWNARKSWWKTDFTVHPQRKTHMTKTGEVVEDGDGNGGIESAVVAPAPPRRRTQADSVETVTVTGARAPQTGLYSSAPVTHDAGAPPPPPPPPPPPRATAAPQAEIKAEARSPEIAIEVADWNPDRPYLKALDDAPADKFQEVLDAQEKEHGNVPAFYLDLGEYLYRHGRKQEAAQMALDALDLPSADASTYAILADRLMRYGETDRAIWLYERIDYLEPDRPQPKRNLALALIARAEHEGADAARGDYTRALGLLAQIVMHDWDAKYDGIEIIALMEANRIVPKLKMLGGKDLVLDPRLIAPLDVDLRVVMEWNTDETDMDLWVDEPSGERAIYNHPHTTIGGNLSNDMRNGYGPEEYVLHHAPSGAYTVRVNVYRSDRINPNGATTVHAHVFRNYGRAGEEQQDLEIELKRSMNGAQLVGVVTVAHGKK